MNLLITSAGRRVSLVRFAQKTLKHFDSASRVHAIDMVPELSAACHIADYSAKAPRVTTDNYGQFLLEYCQSHNITIILPTIDTELSILAGLKELFAKKGITIIVSDQSLCETFYLKSSTFDFFQTNGFKTPWIMTDLLTCQYPLFAKLDNSSCSIGATKVESISAAQSLQTSNERYVFQELIIGEEYTVDFYLSREHVPIMIIPRKRLEVRAGEVSKSVTCKDDTIIDTVKQLSKSLQGGWGPMTLQLFKTQSNQLFLIEINPRVGGGYPLSFHAGMDIFQLILLEALGEKLEYNDTWENNLMMLRYDDEVLVHGHRI
ncbi:ATP-grasp domain-containing protein [uncultured Sulfuricurvum sp.]|uniref:ATP-grasp domain-containing protein n=1 Tax=uncultured Sulfuricurvum sp. TaxID=430693 RepID=UPI002611B53A|nr:ATP-grasp domain-containing protein [uncultured Sulfuricurvum sp.]